MPNAQAASQLVGGHIAMSIVKTRELVNREDIQGIVASGYDHLDYSRFVFLEIKDPNATRKWLASILPRITNARHPGDNKPTMCLNLAFGLQGLEKLVPYRLRKQEFPHEFIRGMNDDNAHRILGDQGESAPKHWEYGTKDQPQLHVLVMLYGTTDKELQSLHGKVFSSREFSDGLTTIAQQDSVIPPDDKTEPFGFRDRISQPPVQGLLGRRKSTEDPINTGEFVLGYENELDLLTQIPSIDNWADPLGYLYDHPQHRGKRKAFGMNGTYLVFRKLLQKVDAFRAYIDSTSEKEEFKAYIDKMSKDSNNQIDGRELLAAKMVGRWRSGAPLVLSPDSPCSEPRNDFLFMETDPDGLACPIGSHIRRAHPRDSLDMPPSRSILISRRHRLLRRARKFSLPPKDLAKDNPKYEKGVCFIVQLLRRARKFLLPPKDLAKNNPKYEQGLFFIVLNADLRRQYEFVQQLWINDPSFNGLDNDRDPLVGDNSSSGEFTIQAKPINRHLRGLPQFVVMRGGGYFFLPGIRAVRFLANYKP